MRRKTAFFVLSSAHVHFFCLHCLFFVCSTVCSSCCCFYLFVCLSVVQYQVALQCLSVCLQYEPLNEVYLDKERAVKQAMNARTHAHTVTQQHTHTQARRIAHKQEQARQQVLVVDCDRLDGTRVLVDLLIVVRSPVFPCFLLLCCCQSSLSPPSADAASLDLPAAVDQIPRDPRDSEPAPKPPRSCSLFGFSWF